MTIAKYLLGSVPRMADDGVGAGADAAAGDNAAVVPAAVAADATGAAAEAADTTAAEGGNSPAASADPAPTPAAAAVEAAKAKGQKAPKWAMERLAEETRAKQQLAAQLEAKDAELRRTQALLDRLQAPADKTPASGPAAQPVKSAAPIPPELIEPEVQRRAEQLLFTQDCNAVAAAGHAAFPDFGETLGILNAVGATSDEFLQDIIATDKAGAHSLMRELAANPERTRQLAGMNSRQRVAELVRMSIPVNPNGAPKPAANVLSRAPAPKAAVSGQASRDEGGLNDQISDDEWSKRWDNAHMRPARANGAAV